MGKLGEMMDKGRGGARLMLIDTKKLWIEFKVWIKVQKNQKIVGAVLLCIAGMILLGWKTFLLIAAVGGAYWMYTQWQKEQKAHPATATSVKPKDADKELSFAGDTVDAMWENLK